jgi:hypothetical protein
MLEAKVKVPYVYVTGIVSQKFMRTQICHCFLKLGSGQQELMRGFNSTVFQSP